MHGASSLSTGLLLTLLLLAYFERKKQCLLSFWEAGSWLGLALLLAILANFMRMLVLVIFNIPSNNPMHDIWGLLSIAYMFYCPCYFC